MKIEKENMYSKVIFDPEKELRRIILRISVVRTKAVRAKIDQMSQKVIISSTTHRTFGRQHWQLLRDNLAHWQIQLNQVLGSLSSIPAQ